MKRNRQLLVVAGILISALFLWLAFRTLNPEAFIAALSDVNLLWLLAGVVVFFASVWVIAYRWQFLLRAIQFVPLRDLFVLVCIGYMGNNVYPFRAGEVLRIALLRRDHGVPLAKGTTTVVVERVFDGLILLSFILIALLFVPTIAPEVRTVAAVAAPIFLTATVIFFILAIRPQIMRQLVALITRLLPGKIAQVVVRLSDEIIDGLEGLRSPADLAGTVISSYGTWAIQGIVYWMVAAAFSLELNYAVMLLVVGVVNLAGLIPATPGQIGVYEFFVRVVLVGVGVAENTALAYAVVVHIVIWLPATVAGLIFLAWEGLNWRAIAHAETIEAASDDQTASQDMVAETIGK